MYIHVYSFISSYLCVHTRLLHVNSCLVMLPVDKTDVCMLLAFTRQSSAPGTKELHPREVRQWSDWSSSGADHRDIRSLCRRRLQ